MTRKLISSGSTFEAEIGYSRAVVDGDWVFVSGTTGFDYSTMTIPDGVVAQAEQCMRNIVHALEQAGASVRDVVRVTYVLPNAAEFEQTWPVLAQILRRDSTRRDDDLGEAGRSTDEDRNRSDGEEAVTPVSGRAREARTSQPGFAELSAALTSRAGCVLSIQSVDSVPGRSIGVRSMTME